ncbi:MAG: HU family DNA-binding protein [Muribaculaceae bacterium]|nr:HU family DNA-binding protein [Muribaculaceae bacterium]
MQNTITLSQFVELMIKNSSVIDNKEEIETVTKQFFNAITDALRIESSVKISDFGSFVINELDPSEISFIPEKSIAEAVNEPFGFFEPVELNNGVTEEMLQNAEIEADGKTESQQEPVAEPPTESVDRPEPIVIPEPETEKETEHATEPVKETGYVPEPVNIPETEEKIVYVYKKVFPWWYALIAGVAAGIVIGLFTFITDRPSSVDNTKLDEIAKIESIDPVPVDTEIAAPVDSIIEETEEEYTDETVITDTIRTNRFLTTMARKHYGEMHFWVYIYEENSQNLGNPDRISPNTIVVIPPAEKYGIDKNNPESVAAAKQKAAEIYSKYKQ